MDEYLPVSGERTVPVYRVLKIYSQQEDTVLISGPTGSGKSRLARWCHARSKRADKPFLSIDLNSIPDNMQLAELFGWKKGSFTSADSHKTGLVELAEGGTLFLDEIDKLSMKSQSGLLEFLDTKAYRTLGESSVSKKADIRVLVGTNVDLMAKVRAGEFREDLYYRIHVLPIQLPPLSQRLDEVEGWARFMLNRAHQDNRTTQELKVDSTVGSVLRAYNWPGNLRQLDNIMRRAYVLSQADMVGFHVKGEHISQSLEFENTVFFQRKSTVLESLNQVADLWIEHSEKVGTMNSDALNDFSTILKGVVYQRVAHHFGGVKEAFTALGKSKSIEGRNYQKEYKREVDRVKIFIEAVG